MRGKKPFHAQGPVGLPPHIVSCESFLDCEVNGLGKVLFNVSSVTNAMRGKSLLEHNGIRAYVGRTVDANGNNGCGYSITVSSEPERAERLLTSAGIHIRSKQQEA